MRRRPERQRRLSRAKRLLANRARALEGEVSAARWLVAFLSSVGSIAAEMWRDLVRRDRPFVEEVMIRVGAHGGGRARFGVIRQSFGLDGSDRWDPWDDEDKIRTVILTARGVTSSDPGDLGTDVQNMWLRAGWALSR